MNNNITIDIINQYQQLINNLDNITYSYGITYTVPIILMFTIILAIYCIYVISFFTFIFTRGKLIISEDTNIIMLTILIVLCVIIPAQLKDAPKEFKIKNFDFNNRDKIISLIEKYPELTKNQITIKNNNKVINIDLSKTNKKLYWSIACRDSIKIWGDIKSDQINNFIKNYK